MYDCIPYNSLKGKEVCLWLDIHFTTATCEDSLQQLEVLWNSSYFVFSRCTSPIPRVSVSYFLWQGISNDPNVYFLLSVRGIVKDGVRFFKHVYR